MPARGTTLGGPGWMRDVTLAAASRSTVAIFFRSVAFSRSAGAAMLSEAIDAAVESEDRRRDAAHLPTEFALVHGIAVGADFS